MAFFSPRVQLKIARSLVTKASPVYVQYYITARCNMTCEQCNIIYAQADCPEMDIHQIRQAAANLAEIGVCVVLLIGGEPFVRTDLPEIVRAFTDHDIHVRLQTNGLATRRKIEMCVDAGAHDISISLDTLDEPVQDTINGLARSWDRALRAVADVNAVFPDWGRGFFGTVLMPRSLNDVPAVVELASRIGWGVSLVPCHTTTLDRPLGFRTFDDSAVCRFPPRLHGALERSIAELKRLREDGQPLYDCDEYLDDIVRFLEGTPVQWRRRNRGVCDSPRLYFAIEPNGNLQPCCDYKLGAAFPVHAPDFPARFRSGEIEEAVFPYTSQCLGCMYGSYPEMTLTARFLKPLWDRFLLFRPGRQQGLRRLGHGELVELARSIHTQHRARPGAGADQ